MEKKVTMGQDLIAGLQEAVSHARGAKKLRSRTVEILEPAGTWGKLKIVNLRKKVYGVSQPVFASMLSVTASTVRAWEQGQKSPSGAARRLLQVAELEPQVFERIAHAGHKSHSH